MESVNGRIIKPVPVQQKREVRDLYVGPKTRREDSVTTGLKTLRVGWTRMDVACDREEWKNFAMAPWTVEAEPSRTRR